MNLRRAIEVFSGAIVLLCTWLLLTASSCPPAASPTAPDGDVLLFIESGYYNGCYVDAEPGSGGNKIANLQVRIYTFDSNNQPVRWGTTQWQSGLSRDFVGNFTIKVPTSGAYMMYTSFTVNCSSCCGYTRTDYPSGCASPKTTGSPLFEYEAQQQPTYYGERKVIQPKMVGCDCNC